MTNQINPARGMRDFMPKEKEKRERAIAIIRDTYTAFGYSEIETPVLENIDRLTGSEGGENLSLIFQVLRRGIDMDESNIPRELVDLGLRYDLTLPLARFYASNQGQLPTVFRAIQIAPVWRAERPQKGRFRQFTQCDIDVIGVDGDAAEIELISVSAQALKALGITGMTVRINDRRILESLLDQCGFAKNDHQSVLIILDKEDKIGLSGVADELAARFPQEAEASQKLMSILTDLKSKPADASLDDLFAALPEGVSVDAVLSMRNIITEVRRTVPDMPIRFDLTLVRGMGYYTGPIFEIEKEGSNSSIAGGGRYDGMIGKFTGTPVPACGFSLGFERILEFISDEILTEQKKLVLFYNPEIKPSTVFIQQSSLVNRGCNVLTLKKPKNLKKAIDLAGNEGFTAFATLDSEDASVTDDDIRPI